MDENDYIDYDCIDETGEDEMELRVKELKKLLMTAGGRCSLCKTYLFLFDKGKTTKIKASHISSRKPEFPSKEFDRFDPSITEEERNKKYENRILTCPECDLMIDNPDNTEYTIERLKEIKQKHENWIRETLKAPEIQEINDLSYVCLHCGAHGEVFIDSGHELDDVIPTCPDCGKELESIY